MSPQIHPPCTPSASCTPVRCHPTPPPCKNPEKCLRKTLSKGVKPCPSAVSVLRTKSKAKCGKCGKFACGKVGDPRSKSAIKKYLKRKSKESKLKRKDRLTGSHSYLKYTRKTGKVRKSEKDCCAGKGHRGRVKRKKCVIL